MQIDGLVVGFGATALVSALGLLAWLFARNRLEPEQYQQIMQIAALLANRMKDIALTKPNVEFLAGEIYKIEELGWIRAKFTLKQFKELMVMLVLSSNKTRGMFTQISTLERKHKDLFK